MRRVPRGQRLIEVAVVALLVGLLASEAWLVQPAQGNYLRVEVSLTSSGTLAYVNSTISGPAGSDVAQAYLWQSQPVRSVHLYDFYEANYPLGHSNVIDWYGVPQHLESVAAFRGLELPVTTVNATQTAQLLSAPPVPGEVLVLASGVLPHTIYGGPGNLLLSWLRAGGTALWIGSPIGYFVGYPTHPTSCADPSNPGAAGVTAFLNASLLAGGSGSSTPPCPGAMDAAYLNSSTFSAALGLGFPYSLPMDDLNTSALTMENGTVLGNLRLGTTNVGAVPEGRGRLIYFGGPLIDVSAFAIEVVSLMMAGWAYGNVELLGSSLLALSSSPVDLRQTVRLPAGPRGTGRLCVLTSQTDLLAEYAQLQCG